MKKIITKYARTKLARIITGLLILTMLGISIERIHSQDDMGVPVQKAPAQTNAAPVVSDASSNFSACPWCWIIVIATMIVVVTTIVVGLMKLCKKLNPPPNNPDDPNNGNNDSSQSSQRLFVQSQGVTLGTKGVCNTLVCTNGEGDNTWDISAWSTNGTDGVPNSPYHDADGFPYCIEFRMDIQSCTNLHEGWSNEAPCQAYGYISFASASVLGDSWEGDAYTNANGYYDTNELAQAMRNILILWKTNGVTAARTYDAMSNAISGSMANIPLTNLFAPSKERYFRVFYPTNN